VSVSRAASGLTLVFEHRAGVTEELTDLVRLEGECCAFAQWHLDSTDDGQLILQITARDEQAVQAVHDMQDAFAAALARAHPAAR
jgi:hypothetical protein